MNQQSVRQLVERAGRLRTVVPGFNIPYLPMMEPVIQALRDTHCFGLVMVARLEWMKFGAVNPQAVQQAYQRFRDDRHVRLHLDHIPAIDEDQQRVDYESIIREAIEIGYDSVMIDGSRLPLDQNIDATRRIVAMADRKGVAVEAELGAVMGHEDGPLPDYDELFASGKGFTDPREAARFVRETGVDWLSVAVGSVHGAISTATRHQRKIAARLNIEHLDRIHQLTDIPLVLHGGTGIAQDCVSAAIRHGIAKINIGTAIRQPFEVRMNESVPAAQQAVYDQMLHIIRHELQIEGNAERLFAPEPAANRPR